jgi:uncharacterized protein
MNALIVDAFEFARHEERREGKLSIADLSRLSKESPGAAGLLQWSLTGGVDKLGHPQLVLSVSASV